MFAEIVERAVGRRLAWKLGRRLYFRARRDGELDMNRNGEDVLQSALVARSVRTGRGLTVIDVGANYGQWSHALLERLEHSEAPAARLTLFEPVPHIREALEKSLVRYPRHQFQIEASAVSDQPGQAQLVVPQEAYQCNHLLSGQCDLEGSTIAVEVTTLDDYLARAADRIDIVKIDAEGFDPKVIQGMCDVLRGRLVDVVQFEYSWQFIRSRAYLYDIFELADSCGYSVALLTTEGFEVFPTWNPDLERFHASAMVLLSDGASDILPLWRADYEADNTRRLTRLHALPCAAQKQPEADTGAFSPSQARQVP